MTSLLLALLLSQTQPAVRRSTPQSDDPGMVVRQVGTLPVTCTNCSSIILIDGGTVPLQQGPGQDGGPWTVWIEGGAISVSSSVSFDGGSIGYMRMPDGGALEVYSVNGGGSGGGWTPDGGYIGLVYAITDGGVTAYQGGAWTVGVSGSVAVTGPLTDAQLRATPVPVSGTVAATQSGTWAVRNQDGVGNALASSTAAPAGTEQALIVRNIPSGTQPVSAASLPLPSGASTSALQTTGNTSLSNIDTDLDVSLSTRLSESTFAARFPAVSLLADGTANPSLTATASYLMGYNGTTWDRLRSTTANGLLVDVSRIQGTVTANAGSGTFTVGQGTASNLRAQTASESATGAAIPSSASLAGFYDTSNNLRPALVTDVDSSGSTLWSPVMQVGGACLGAPCIANVETSVPYTSASTGMYVWEIKKNVTNPVTTTVSCGTSATAAPSSILTNRTTLTVINNSSVVIYLGGSGVTTANGFPLQPGQAFSDDVTDATYYCRVASGTADLRVLEN